MNERLKTMPVVLDPGSMRGAISTEKEKDRIRAHGERQKEDDAARRDFDREKTRLAKERAHCFTAPPGCTPPATPLAPRRSRSA
jgi:hypothetical protein